MGDKSLFNHDIANRKKDHIDICLNKQVESTIVTTLFEEYYLIHQALPEIYFNDIKV